VLSDRSLRDRMRVEGKARAQNFHVDKITREYEKLFLKVLEGD
ncbi:MAG: N-acetyl-alpha-D-glucosaminyl L-malate synthase BshA, partial [Deltaproteobacteria bacterium]